MAGSDDFQATLMEGTQDLLGRLDRAMTSGAAAVQLQVGNIALDGVDSIDPDTLESMQVIQGQLAEIVGKGVLALQTLHDLAPGQLGTFELVTGEPERLALGPGEENTRILDVDSTANNEKKDKAPGKGEKNETRNVRPILLVSIFGEDKVDEIYDLDDEQVVFLGETIGDLYTKIPIGSRGKALQPTRAEQFRRYIGGDSLKEMSADYGIAETSFNIVLRKAVEIIQREVPKEALGQIFDRALEEHRQR